MKVKVGNTIFDGEVEPVMVIMTDKDKENIANMAEGATKYASAPDDFDKDDFEAWMSENG